MDKNNIETTQHEDGRKDVKIKVNMLDVNEKDPMTQKAKKHIEENVIPKLADAYVTVIVIHTPTIMSASAEVILPRVREWAEFAANSFKDQQQQCRGAHREEFIVVEVPHTTMLPRVTSLVKMIEHE